MTDLQPLIDQGRAAWVERNLFKAKRLAEQALAAKPEGELLARARLLAGVVYREIGDTAMALDTLSDLDREWERYPGTRPLLEGYTLYNLALVYHQRREYGKSVEFNRRAAVEFRQEGMTDHLRRSLQNAAWSLCALGLCGDAQQALDQAEPLCHDDDGLWHQRIGRAFAHFAASEHVTCIDLTTEIIRLDQAPTDVLSHALWLLGRSKLALGSLDEAIRIADGAILYAVQTQDTRCLSNAQALRRSAIEAKQARGA